YEVDLVTAALSPLGGGGTTPVTALTVEPDGGVWLAEGDRLFSTNTGGLFYEHLLGPLYGLAADDTTLFLVGTTWDPGYVVVGSTHYTSAITIEMHSHDQSSWFSDYSVFGVLPNYGNFRPIGLAMVPEPGAGLLISAGLVFLVHWGRRRD
ncbi:MAG: hypothetical protein VX246_06360, partial [Myxococcota bacterium]|nr:hypothetical protein [Myxococcota bacterium]